MTYNVVVDEQRQLVWVRYSGTVSVAERRAAAEQVLSQPANRQMRRFLLDYRRATTLGMDESASTDLAEFLAAMLGDLDARVAWLVTYDHQLDPDVEGKTLERGVSTRRFRDFDEAVAWLQQGRPAQGKPGAAQETDLTASPLCMDLANGAAHASRAQGTFEVKIAPQSPDSPPAQAAGLMRLSLDKRYSGPLEGVGQGEMLADGGGDRKDGAYVALERVTGTLHGRAGSFALVHRALMRDGTPREWTVVVVPGSGTGELAGVEGALRIIVEKGVHSYDLEYTLPG